MTDSTAVLLYVEDNKSVQNRMVPLLEDAGFEVLLADDGAQALGLIATQVGPIDGLLTDVDLGVGPNGWNVARKARRRMASMPVVYASSVEEADWMVNGVPLSEMVHKPYRLSHVLSALSSTMDRAAMPSAPRGDGAA